MSGTPPPGGWYPQEAYYAPGWQQPVGPPPPRRRWGLWLGVGIAILVGLALAAAVLVWVLMRVGTQTLGEVESPTQANARQLRTGHCIEELPTDGAVDLVTVVPCDSRHDAEVVGALTLDDGEWPGDRAVQQQVEGYCEMDTAQLEAGLQAVAWSPSEASWAQGDRGGLCLAWSPTGQVRGSWTTGGPVTPTD